MIKRISLKNVRLFSDKDYEITVPPLAIFCGTNSAGKSTVLKALLLLRQSQGLRENQTVEKGRLKFAGSQVDVGDYSSLVSHNEIDREIGLGIAIEAIASRDWIFSLLKIKHGVENPLIGDKTNEDYLPYTFSADFTFFGNPPKNKKYTTKSRCRLQGVLKTAKFSISFAGISLLEWSVSIAPNAERTEDTEFSYVVELPSDYFLKIGGSRMIDIPVSKESQTVTLSTILRGLLPDSVGGRLRRKDKAKEEALWNQWPMPPQIVAASNEFKRALSKLFYLGPLRSPAKRFYLTHLTAR